MLCYHFSSEAVVQGMTKNNPTENKSKQKFKRHWSMRHHENWQKRKCKVYCYLQLTRSDLHQITTTYLNMFSFGLSSVISKVFVADFEHVFVCLKRYSTKTIVVLILKYLAQQTNTYSKSAAETLKQDVKSIKS